MSESESRSLHLHTLDSLVVDLVSGRSVITADGKPFSLPDEWTRSALEWYRKKGAAAWTSNVSVAIGEDLIDAILLEPPELTALLTRPANAQNRRLRLKKLVAHRFAGLHKFGTPDTAPENYVHEFTSPLTLFEGRNGSGKTSILNAIIWALTGEILRPQREPETAEDFECWVAAATDDGEQTAHKLSSVTPMPNVAQYRPDQKWIPADTWVELTFIDENDEDLPVIRRSQSRTNRGKLQETEPDLSTLAIDPIAVRIGTIMPGLLPLIKVGSESELGRAVSQLTGLSALNDLTDHVRRVKNKIDKDLVRSKKNSMDQVDLAYITAKQDLGKIVGENSSLKLPQDVPAPSEDKKIEESLENISEYFQGEKAAAFESARDILGESFDSTNSALLADLEKNIRGAIERASEPQALKSAARLGALRKLTSEDLNSAEERIFNILAEAKTLDALAKNPSQAARTRLYARIATWIADHPDLDIKDDACTVCGGTLDQAVDPVTGRPVNTHLHEAATDAELLSQTLRSWSKNAQGDLLRSLPQALQIETATDLPPHPCDLLRDAIVKELFSFEPFKGILSELKAHAATVFDGVVKDLTELADTMDISLPKECDALCEMLKKLEHAIRFARWGQENDMLVREIVAQVLGQVPKDGESNEKITLTGKLLDLETTVKAAQPITDALTQCNRLKSNLKTRRAAEKRLSEYAIASSALENLASLGQLADEQVDQLRKTLRKEAAEWRSRIYRGAFPDTEHELIDTGMGRKGELDLVVQTGGVAAPAQHVTNASALRASLVGFFLAFWEYVLNERGGLTILILDDPQELLDDENRERLSASFAPLVENGAQLIVTSYDSRFCGHISRLHVAGGVEHLAVDPATQLQPVVRTTLTILEILKRKELFDTDRNAEEPARDFADRCRVYFEAKLGDMFDDPAHLSWVLANPHPTLATFIDRLQTEVKAGPRGMFSANVFRTFVNHPATANSSSVLELMNKAHHGRRQDIRAADVAHCADDLIELLELAEKMYEECYRWRRRDKPKDQTVITMPSALTPMSHTVLNVEIYPDLAAFTQNSLSGASQEALEYLDPHIFDNTVAYYLSQHNFGFAAPVGSIAIIEAIPGPGADRSLVIARHGSVTYARRLVRDSNSVTIGLTADMPDPRKKTPKTFFLPEAEVAIHQVIGVIFDHSISIARDQNEAAPVDVSNVFERIEIAFRVVDDSAVPLALEKQVVLGGSNIALDEIGHYKDQLVALALDDGSSIFKRVGSSLPNELAHLRQFESIGGLGSSEVLSVGKPHDGFRYITHARVIIGVLYQI